MDFDKENTKRKHYSTSASFKVKYKRRSSINDFTALVVNFVYIVIVILKYIGIHVNYQRGNTEREAIFENIVLI